MFGHFGKNRLKRASFLIEGQDSKEHKVKQLDFIDSSCEGSFSENIVKYKFTSTDRSCICYAFFTKLFTNHQMTVKFMNIISDGLSIQFQGPCTLINISVNMPELARRLFFICNPWTDVKKSP